MHFDPPLVEALLVKRYKRFLADVILANVSPKGITTVHCPNTGSMKNCQPANARVWCSISNNPKRKYPLTWELIEAPAREISTGTGKALYHFNAINTHRANPLVEEAIHNGTIIELQEYDTIRREVKYGNSSRIDLLLQSETRPNCYVEVKSVTLHAGQGVGLFPDAVTQRGTRHLEELTAMVKSGARAVLLFCVQHTGITCVKPAVDIDPDYTQALHHAYKNGVEIFAYTASITPQHIALTHALPVDLFDG